MDRSIALFMAQGFAGKKHVTYFWPMFPFYTL